MYSPEEVISVVVSDWVNRNCR